MSPIPAEILEVAQDALAAFWCRFLSDPNFKKDPMADVHGFGTVWYCLVLSGTLAEAGIVSRILDDEDMIETNDAIQ